MTASRLAPVRGIATHRTFTLRTHWRAIAAGVLFGVCGLVSLILSDRAFSIVIPLVFALQATIMGFATRKRSNRDRPAWVAFEAGIALLIVNSAALPRYRMNPTNRLAGIVAVVALVLEMACFTAGAIRVFLPFLRVPVVARMVKLGLVGFVVASTAIQWHLFGTRPGGWGGTLALSAGVVGAMCMLIAVLSVTPRLLRFDRRADVVIAGAGVVYGIGQAAALLHSNPVVPTGYLFCHSLMATGVLVAASLLPEMVSVGQPIPDYPPRRAVGMPPAVAIVFVLVDGALAGLALGPWPVPRLVMLLAVAVAAQTVAIAWLSGRLFGLLRRLGLLSNHRLRQELRSAIAHDHIEAHFQPIVRKDSSSVAGYETLARWPHSRLGLLTAQQFIALAESEGLLASIDHRMLRLAAEALPTLLATSPANDVFLTVNVDPQRMQEPAFARRILRELDGAGLDPRGLVVELTETAAIHDWDELRRNVADFQAAGVGLAIDDFGAGHANFGLLVQLEPDIVKLDQSLIEAAFLTRRGRLVVRNAVAAAQATGAKTIAEGVSDAEWAPALFDLGFDYLQGYAFGKADSADSYAVDGGRFIA